MSRILITGSSEGLGLLAAQRLIEHGHHVTLHARTKARAADARRAAPEAEAVVIGDVSTLAAMRSVADQANALGGYDAVIHNVGVGFGQGQRRETPDGLAETFAVNVLAPYLLTAMMTPPERLVYLSSGMHRRGNPALEDLQWRARRWDGMQAYADSKLLDVMLAFALARRWQQVLSNALDPGWVPTRMGGADAPDDLSLGVSTQVWLAASEDPKAKVTGQYFYHQALREPHPATRRADLQEQLLDYCAELTGTAVA